MTHFSDLAPFSAAEEKLIAGCSGPERVVFGDGEVPGAAPAEDAPVLRAVVLRQILLGAAGAPRLHDKGLRLRGAHITGALDLQGCDCPRDITLSQCRLEGAPNLVNASLRGLHLSGGALPGLSADNARFSGSVYLRDDIVVAGEISLAGARIGGDLQICGASIASTVQDAIFAPSLRVQGSVFLGNYPYTAGETTLQTQGMIFLSSVRIDHDLFISHVAVATNTGDLTRTVFGATEEHGADMALSLARARVGGILYMQALQISGGIVNLAGASVARLTDEPAGQGAQFPIRLDGFRYDDFSRHADTGIAARLSWLERRPPETPFTAQPYEHLARVLNQLGQRDDALSVLMRKERLSRAEDRRVLRAEGGAFSQWLWELGVDRLLRWTVGYGYRPSRSVLMAFVLIVMLGIFFEACWKAGDMTPNAAPILTSGPWIAATQSHPDNPGAFWSAPGQAGQDWETFNGFAYAADLFIPLVSLGQESAWAPSTARSPLGRVGWWLRWFAKAIGWVVTALGAAAITGVIRRD